MILPETTGAVTKRTTLGLYVAMGARPLVYIGIQGIHGYTGYTGVYMVYRVYMGIQGIHGYTGYTGVYMVYREKNSLLLLHEGYIYLA